MVGARGFEPPTTPKDAEYKLTVDRGLYIRVAPSGVKTWLVRYMVDGKQKQFRLPKPYGISGNGFMSLSDARMLNATIQALAKTGIDYQNQQAEKRQQKIADEIAEIETAKTECEKNLTFQDVFDAWIKDGVNRTDGNEMIIRTFKNHAMPTLGKIDRCQNHVLAGSKVRRHYLHHEYEAEKREAWDKLGKRLEEILAAA